MKYINVIVLLFFVINIFADGIPTNRARKEYPKFELLPSLKDRDLPLICDNSTKEQFPPIISQYKTSCGQASSMGYHFAYERNLTLNTSSKLPENIMAYNFTWNFINDGNGGSWPHEGYEIAKKMGCANSADFEINNRTAWLNGYEKYYNANDCHVTDIVSFKNHEIEKLKNWFYDKGTGTGKNGGLVTFASNMVMTYEWIWEGKIITNIAKGKLSHAMTLVGYNDNISCDLNKDGKDY